MAAHVRAPSFSAQPPYGVPSSYPLSEALEHLSLSPSSAELPRAPEQAKPHPLPVPELAAREGVRKEARRIYGGPALSQRATGGPDAGPLIERFSCLFNDIYCADTNPHGIVSLGVAENLLMAPELLDFFGRKFAECFLESDLTYGDHLWGSRRLTAALATFYNDFFNPAEPVEASHLIVGTGCSAILDQVTHTILDAGDGILLTQPYYSGFDRDLRPRSGALLYGVNVDVAEDDGDGDCWEGSVERRFGKRLEEARQDGVRIRAMIVCNPQNPLGKTYSRKTLLEYCLFAEKHDLHLISDEIYGMSVFDNAAWPSAAPFTSMLSLAVEKETGVKFDPARLHVVHGMSKDYSSNGLRLGVLITQHNPLLLRTLAQTSMLMKISSPADVLFTALLTSPPPASAISASSTVAAPKSYVEWFTQENRRRLTEAHAYVRGWFEERGCPVADSNAGHFVWVDIGARMGWTTTEQEKAGFQRLLDGGVYIAPGSAYHASKPGRFRVTFSVKRANLLVGLEKLERILGIEPKA